MIAMQAKASNTMAKRKKTARSGAANSRTAIVVLGMHRSGTSALTGVLGQMGCDLPKDLMAPADMNAKGFFESDGITGLNESLLASAGQSWFSFPRFPADWFASPKAAEFSERAVEQIEASYGRSFLYVIKDPRICRLLPFWKPAIARANSRPLFVCIHRHPLDVSASLSRWANYEPDYSLLLWLRHVLDAEAETRGERRVFTSFDGLMTDWPGTVQAIGDGLGLSFPRDVANAAPTVEEFLTEELRHFRQPSGAAKSGPMVPEWISATYEILERWVAKGENSADYKLLDDIRAGFDEASRSFAAIAWRSQTLRFQAQHSQRESDARRQAVEELGVEVKAQEHARAQADEALQVKAAQLQDAEARNADLTAAVADLDAQLLTTTDALAKAQQDRDQSRSELEQRRQEAEDLHRQTVADARKILDLQEALKASESRLASLENQASRDAKHLAAITRQLSARLARDLDQVLAAERSRDLGKQSEDASLSARLRRLTESEAEAERLKEQASILEARRQAAEQCLAEATARNADLELRLAEADNHRHQLLSSTSWRITGPLRRVVTLLRGK